MKDFRFHVVALPHLATNKANNACAYTQKVLNFCKMMTSLGYRVFHYGAEGSEVECREHVQIISQAEQNVLLGLYHKDQLPTLPFDPSHTVWQLHNARAVVEIKQRLMPRDFLCLIAGTCQQPILRGLKEHEVMPVEYGVGYGGTFCDNKVYESYSHMHLSYGRKSAEVPDGHFYDAVIPNYYDAADFPLSPSTSPGDYFLYVGRMTRRKGLEIAVDMCDKLKAMLVMAGQGIAKYVPATPRTAASIVTGEGQRFTGRKLQYAGHVDIPTRNSLMANAKAVLVPTIYCEPFGGVAVEAQLCGTPCITTDFGAFTETVLHGVSGFRCHTLEQFVWAGQNVGKLDRQAIYDRAHARWTLERIAPMYDEYFHMLNDLWGAGWPTLKDRKNLDWLNLR